MIFEIFGCSFIFMKLRQAQLFHSGRSAEQMIMFSKMQCSPIIKSVLINSPIYKLMGKEIFPGFLVYNTHFMQRETKCGYPGVSTLTLGSPCFCHQIVASSPYLVTPDNVKMGCELLPNSVAT